MRILIEAHHPAHIHFWKYPIRELQARGHEVLMIGRDRDVMRRLLGVYDWIPAEIPRRETNRNRFPLFAMLGRQFAMFRALREFRPQVVASLMGSYTQLSKCFGCKNLVFTDSEHQSFNHKIAHPFADEIHTPECFYLDLGVKQTRYDSIHELAFLNAKYYQPNAAVLDRYDLNAGAYVVIRLSAWNTLHDVSQSGIGERIYGFVNAHKAKGRILIVAEEGKLPAGLEMFATQIAPQDFHCVLAFARFVLTEGASTASEASCLGVPTVYINSIPTMGYLNKLSGECSTLECFQEPTLGMNKAEAWLSQIEQDNSFDFEARNRFREELCARHIDLLEYVVDVIEAQAL